MSRNYELKALITGVDKLSPMIKQMRAKLGGLRRDFRSAADGALPMAGVVGLGLGSAAKAFADAEDAATGLEVAMMRVGGKAGPEFRKISDLAGKLGNRLPGTTAEFQDMMTMLVRQGVPATNILGGLGEATAYLAVQLKKPPAEAAEFAAKLQDATKTVSGDMMGLMDVIQRTFYLGVDDGNMLAAFTKLSPALDMIRLKGLAGAKAMAPLVVMMDQAGLAGESSGNAIRKVLQAGFDADKVGKVNRMTGLGLDFTNGKGEFGGIDKMFAQLDKLKALNTQQRTGVLKTLFGDDAESLQVVSTMIDKGLGGYQEVQGKMASQASLQLRVNKQLGTLKNLWDSASGTFTNALVSFGEAISPELKSLTGWMGGMSERMQTFAKDNPGVVRGFAALAVGLTAFKLAALGGGMAIKVLMGFASMSPLGIFIRLMVAGAALIIANWKPIKGFFIGMWSGITAFVRPAWEFMLGLFSFTPLGQLVANWGPVSGFFGAFWDGLKAMAGGWFGFLKDAFLNFTPLGLVIKNWEPLVAWFKGMWERVAPFVRPLLGAVERIRERGRSLQGGHQPLQVNDSIRAGRRSLQSGSLVQAQAQAGRQQLQGQIDINFQNAPPGMRTAPAKTSQPGVRVMPNVGYNRFATP